MASVAFYYDESHLNDFEVKLQLDKYSNSFLNLSLQGQFSKLGDCFTKCSMGYWSIYHDIYIEYMYVCGHTCIWYNV